MKTFSFESQSLTNAISLPLVYSTSSKHVFIAVSNFSDRKKTWNLTLPVQFSPPHPGKSQIPTPGKALQIKFPSPRTQNIVKCPGFAGGGGGGNVELSIWSAHNNNNEISDSSYFYWYILIVKIESFRSEAESSAGKRQFSMCANLS